MEEPIKCGAVAVVPLQVSSHARATASSFGQSRLRDLCCLHSAVIHTFTPVCAGSPASQFLRHGVELARMSGDSGVGSGVLMLEWRSLGGEEVVLPGSTAGSCKEVGSGRCPT
ncbi:hypothetical protein BHE74_00028458 [Ensete ventricosum]|nr:hypothetical protein BHE74_00028458 [Ensete ventricosum]